MNRWTRYTPPGQPITPVCDDSEININLRFCNSGINLTHTFRIFIPNLITILDKRMERLEKMVKSQPNFKSKVDLEAKKTDKVKHHLEELGKIMDLCLPVMKAFGQIKKAQIQIDIINMIIQKLDPRPLLPSYMDKNNHASICGLCKQLYKIDRESYTKLSELVDPMNDNKRFDDEYDLITNEVYDKYRDLPSDN